MALFGRKNEAVSTIKVNYDGKKAERGLSKLKKTVAGVITALALKQIAGYTYELSALGAQAEMVEKNFEKFAKTTDKTTDEMLASMKKATMGMVNDMELQQKAMQAMVAGISFDDMIVAMEYVTKFALATGTDVSAKMQTTMTGLARGSAQFMDDIGIQVMGAKDVVGASIDQMKEKMDSFAMSESDTAVEAQNLKVEFENLKMELGKALLPVLETTITFMNKYAIPAFKKFNEVLGFREKPITDRLAIDKKIREDIKEEIKGVEKLIGNYDVLVGKGITLTKTKEQLKTELKGLNKELKLFNEEIEKEQKKRIKEGEKFKVPTVTPKKKKVKDKEDDDDWFQRLVDRQLAEEDMYEMLTSKRQRSQDELAEINDQELENETELFYAKKELREREAQEEKDALAQRYDNAQSFVSTMSTINGALAMMSDARTQKEIRNLEKMGLSEKELEERKEKILEEGLEKRRAFARLQQGIAIAEATINAFKMGVGAGADAPGGPVTRALAVAAALATGFAQVAAIQATNFQTGRIGEVTRGRQADTIQATIGRGETIISAPQTQAHEEDLRAIQNNTANTRGGALGGGATTNNFYGMSTETVLQVIDDSRRRDEVGSFRI